MNGRSSRLSGLVFISCPLNHWLQGRETRLPRTKRSSRLPRRSSPSEFCAESPRPPVRAALISSRIHLPTPMAASTVTIARNAVVENLTPDTGLRRLTARDGPSWSSLRTTLRRATEELRNAGLPIVEGLRQPLEDGRRSSLAHRLVPSGEVARRPELWTPCPTPGEAARGPGLTGAAPGYAQVGMFLGRGPTCLTSLSPCSCRPTSGSGKPPYRPPASFASKRSPQTGFGWAS